jgi:FkbM family methyltransferase
MLLSLVLLAHVGAAADELPFGRRQGRHAVLQDVPLAAGATMWAAYKEKLLAAPRVRTWACESERLAVLDYSTAMPPAHSLPARPRSNVTGMGKLPIIAEFTRGTCDVLRAHGCERFEGGAADTPDGWILDMLEVALAGCNEEASEECFAMDVGSNLGLIALRMLQAGSHVVAAEPQSDLCCAAHHTAAFNDFGDRAIFLPSGIAVSTVDADAMIDVALSAYRYGKSTDGSAALSAESFMRKHGAPLTGMPLHKLETALGPRGIHYQFIKLDTDSVDCDLLRELVDRQRNGELTFGTVSLEVWAGKHCTENGSFGQLLFDVQSDGYDIYRTPATSYTVPAVNPYSYTRMYDTAPKLTRSAVKLPTTTLLRMRKLSLAEWTAAPKNWAKGDQLLVSKLELPVADILHSRVISENCTPNEENKGDCVCQQPFVGPTCDALPDEVSR